MRILLVSHRTATPGIGEKLLSYFTRHKYDVSVITHPLYPSTLVKSRFEFSGKTIEFKIPAVLQFLVEGIVTMIVMRFKGGAERVDLALCLDPLSFVDVFLMKLVYPVRKVVYYNVDYSPTRFANKLLNDIYQRFNLFAFQNSNGFFYLSKEFIKDIDPQNKFKDKSFYLSHTTRMVKNPMNKRKKNAIVFAGTLNYGIDFTHLLKALARLKKNGRDFILDIYGDGTKRQEIADMIQTLKLSNVVTMKGVEQNEMLTQKIFPQYRIGVAPFVLKQDFNADQNLHLFIGEQLSTKIVEYIGAGLPVIVTPSYEIFKLIPENKFGFVVKTEDEWYDALSRFLTDEKLNDEYSQNAYRYAKRYDEDSVLTPIIKKLYEKN